MKTKFNMTDRKFDADAPLKVDQVIIKWEFDDCPDLSYLENKWDYDEETGGLTIISSCAYKEKTYTGEEAQEHLRYCQEDQARLESYGLSWIERGCYAVCIISYPAGQGSRRIETLRSAGLWGIESDSSKEYHEETEREQYEELADHIKSLGINVTLPPFEDCIREEL